MLTRIIPYTLTERHEQAEIHAGGARTPPHTKAPYMDRLGAATCYITHAQIAHSTRGTSERAPCAAISLHACGHGRCPAKWRWRTSPRCPAKLTRFEPPEVRQSCQDVGSHGGDPAATPPRRCPYELSPATCMPRRRARARAHLPRRAHTLVVDTARARPMPTPRRKRRWARSRLPPGHRRWAVDGGATSRVSALLSVRLAASQIGISVASPAAPLRNTPVLTPYSPRSPYMPVHGSRRVHAR